MLHKAASKIKVYGTLTLKDDYYGEDHPLAGVKVYIYSRNTLNTPFKREECITNDKGYFEKVVDNSKGHIKKEHSMFIKYETETDNVRVCQNGATTITYKVELDNVAIGDKTSIPFNHGIDEKGYTGKSFHILMLMEAASRMVKSLGYKCSFVIANYPGTVSHTKQSWAHSKRIHLADGEYNTCTVLHEYGHCFQNMLGCKYEGDLPGFHHNDLYDLTGYYSKEKGCYTAFFEAFADVFRYEVTCQYNGNEQLIHHYECTALEYPFSFSFIHSETLKAVPGSYESRCQKRYGEAYEISCISLMLAMAHEKFGPLFDKAFVYDNEKKSFIYKNYKLIQDKGVGYKTIVDMFATLANAKHVYMHYFVKLFEAKYASNIDLLDKLHFYMSYTHIAPYGFNIETINEKQYKVSFTPGGYNDKEDWGTPYGDDPEFRNGCTLQKKFKATIYKANGQVFDTINNISNHSFIVPKLSFKEAGGPKYTVSVSGIANDGNMETGWYESGKVVLDSFPAGSDKGKGMSLENKKKDSKIIDKVTATNPALTGRKLGPSSKLKKQDDK